LQAKSLLLGLKEVEGSHSGENIAACCLPVIGDFELEGKIGYFVSDNVGSNDLAVDAFCRELKLKNSKARRLRCLGHVINLAAKAFLFGKEEECFDFEVSELESCGAPSPRITGVLAKERSYRKATQFDKLDPQHPTKTSGI
jgi:hypothetical protein